MRAWAVIGVDGKIVNWRSVVDGEEGLEIHRTRRLAFGSRCAGESVAEVRVTLVRERKGKRKSAKPIKEIQSASAPKPKAWLSGLRSACPDCGHRSHFGYLCPESDACGCEGANL